MTVHAADDGDAITKRIKEIRKEEAEAGRHTGTSPPAPKAPPKSNYAADDYDAIRRRMKDLGLK